MIAIESYRQAIRNNRILVKIIAILAILILVLTIALALLFPLKKTEYVLYEFSPYGISYKKIASSEDVIERSEILVGAFMRNYVFNREVIDNLTEADRFLKIAEQSSTEVFEQFKELYNKIKLNLGEKGTRKIEIKIDYPFNNDYNAFVYVVEFMVINIKNNKEVKQHYKAIIGYELNEQKIRLDNFTQNPLGVDVVSYSIYKLQ